MNGLLLVDKPSGWTSFDVVAKVRGHVRQQTGVKKPKVGHTGTLDPLATGLMLIVVGSFCKRAAEFSGLDKRYEVEITLGYTTETGDAEAERQLVSEAVPLDTELAEVLRQFSGTIMQRPPAYSALKVNGQRSYKLARAGRAVTLSPRPVTIYELRLMQYAYPFIRLDTKVSSGTYLRSLVFDIGQALQTGAYMSGLRRTVVGPYHLADAITVNDFEQNLIDKLLTKT